MNNNSINNSIDELKKLVWFEMDWSQKNNDGTRIFPNRPETELIFNKEIALAILLICDVIFLNDYWWKSEKHDKTMAWPEDACKVASLNVNTNDVLMWGCADADSITYDEIQEVYEHWEKDPAWGTAVWYCKKLNMMPQKPVADRIRAMGIWDLDKMNLEKNPTG